MSHLLADPGFWPWLFIIGFLLLLGWSLWPANEPKSDNGGTTITTEGPNSPGFGTVHGNVTQVFHPPPPDLPPQTSPWDDPNFSLQRPLPAHEEDRPAKASAVYPDMVLAAVIERAKKRIGRPPNESDQALDHFILDGVVNRPLRTWGRIEAGRPVTPIPSEAWERGDFSHVRGTLRFKPNIHERELIEWKDVHFSNAQVKRWLKPDLGPNGWMAGDV